MRNPILHLSRPRLPWRGVSNAPSFEGELSTHYLSLANARYFVAKLVAPADALIKPLPTGFVRAGPHEHRNIGNGLLVLRGFERLDDSATVQEWRCEVSASCRAASFSQR
jgi:hypothetical protein